MTDFMESVRPAEPMTTIEPVMAGPPGEASVRDLLAELAHLEDVVRAAGAAKVPVGDPELLATMAREQTIIDELRRRNPAP